MARRLVKTLKGTGFRKVQILLEDGSPVEGAAEEEGAAQTASQAAAKPDAARHWPPHWPHWRSASPALPILHARRHWPSRRARPTSTSRSATSLTPPPESNRCAAPWMRW